MIWRPSFGTEDVLQLEGVGPRMMAELMMEKTTGCLKDIPSQKARFLYIHIFSGHFFEQASQKIPVWAWKLGLLRSQVSTVSEGQAEFGKDAVPMCCS